MSRDSARRFLFSTTSGYGHFHPLVPLARALQQAGHAVAFAARPAMQPLVEASGFAFFPAGGRSQASRTAVHATGSRAPAGAERETDPEYLQFKAHMQTMPGGLDAEMVIYSWLFCGIAPRLKTPDLVKIGRSWKPDMFIREAAEYGAVIAAEHLGLPHAAVSFAANLQGLAIFEQGAAAQLDPIRRRWGLAPDPTLSSLYRYLFLAYSPPGFALQEAGAAGAAVSIPASTHFIRPEFFDHAGAERLPDWVARLPAQPTVYVTLGTEVNKTPELYPSVLQTIISGLRDLPVNLIVTLGRDKDPADFGAQPANVHIERYIPQSLLLRECDLMVMHGGSNSLLAALDTGLPMVVVPLIADQFFNAHVTQSIGLGQVVQREQLTPATIRAAVEEVLSNPMYRQTAGRLHAEMHALPGQEYAVGLVEGVAALRSTRT